MNKQELINWITSKPVKLAGLRTDKKGFTVTYTDGVTTAIVSWKNNGMSKYKIKSKQL